MRLLLALSVAAGCTSGPGTLVVDRSFTGSYRIDVGQGRVTDARDVVISPTTVPQCCFDVWRRSNTTFEIGTGNWVASPPVSGACPELVHARLYISGVADAGTFALDASNAALAVWSEQPSQPCPRALSPEGQPVWSAVSGQLKLDELHCASGQSDLGCALVARGSFAIASDEVDASGEFAASDEASTW